MTRKKTSKRKSSKHNAEHAQRNKRIAIGSAVVLLASGVFVGGAMGVGELDRKAASFVVPMNPSVRIDWPMTSQGVIWMPNADRDEIATRLSRAVQGGKGLSIAPLEEASLALMSTGWINGTPTARWTSEGEIMIDAQWRVPVAAIRVGTREIIIDRDRHALPLDYQINESNQLYFMNVDARQPEIGQQWLGTDLQDGLALLTELETHKLLEQVAGFDLGEGADSGTIRIITTRGAGITWGGGPGRERPGEVPTSQKIDRLRTLFERTGLIDGGLEYLDISGVNMTKQRAEG